MARVRLDTLLAERGLFGSRSRAAASVMAGEVLVGPERRRIDKPGHMVADDVMVAVDEAPDYVSRGGTKLANALDALDVEVAGRRALDVGASTGGFTDVLLRRGAAHVIALDVAYGELHWTLRNDDRVTVIERTNARAIAPADLPYAPDLIVVDVSFISLKKVLPAVLECASAGGSRRPHVGPEAGPSSQSFDCLAMVKPQFEVGRENVGRGVVHDPALRREAIDGVVEAVTALGFEIAGEAESGLPGPKGNIETFLWIR